MRSEIHKAVDTLLDKQQPPAKTNVGKLCATYATLHTVQKYVETMMENKAPELRSLAAFDDNGKACLYMNSVFSVTAKQNTPRRTFSRERALVALAKRFKLSYDEAEKFLDAECYAIGNPPAASLSVDVK